MQGLRLSLLWARIALSLNTIWLRNARKGVEQTQEEGDQGHVGLKQMGMRRHLESRGLAGQLPTSADRRRSC